MHSVRGNSHDDQDCTGDNAYDRVVEDRVTDDGQCFVDDHIGEQQGHKE